MRRSGPLPLASIRSEYIPTTGAGFPCAISGNVTGLLEKALRRVEALSGGEQDAIDSQILETLNDEESWKRYVRKNRDVFRSLAREALEEHWRNETQPLEDLLGE
jgi:hypothetical protein